MTGITWDVMINQGASVGGIEQLFNGVLRQNLRCVDWQQAKVYGEIGGFIGAVAAPAIYFLPSAASASYRGASWLGSTAYNAAPSAYAHWLYYSTYKLPWLGKAATTIATGIGMADNISDNILRVRALLGDPYAQASMAEAMATWDPTLALRSSPEIPEGNNIVYRALRPDERRQIHFGLFGRSWPADEVSPISHVAGQHHSPWISTGKYFDRIKQRFDSGNGIAIIDLSKVGNQQIVDYSNGIAGYEGSRHSNAAQHYGEILVKDYIPPEAILGVIDTSK